MAIEAAKLLVRVGADLSEMERGLGDADKRMTSTLKSLESIGKKMSVAVSLPLAGLGAASLRTAANFEKAGNKMEAITGANAKEMEALRRKALQLGKDTSFSAGEAMTGMLELGKAGVEVNEIYDGISGTMLLAAAADIEVGTAAEIAANALNVFGLQGKDVTRVADMLAATANSSSVEIGDLADSLNMVGAVAAAAGIPIEDVNTALGILGNQGMKGSDAGTSLKQMLLSLQAPSKKAAELMSELGIQVYDAEGNMRDMRSIIGSLAVATEGLTQEERDFALATIFGSDAVRAANILIAEGTPEWDKMAAKVNEAGAAQKAADANMRGLAGAVEYFKGTMDSLMIDTATPWLDTLSQMIRGAADLIAKFGELPPKVQQAAVMFGVAAMLAGPFLFVCAKLVGPLVDIARFATRAGSAVVTTAGKLAGERGKLDDLANSANKAADAKGKVANKNDELAKSAGKASDALGREAGAMGELAKGAAGGATRGLGGFLGGFVAGGVGTAIGSIGVGAILGGLGTALAGVAAGIAAIIASPAVLIGAAIVGAIVAAIAVWQNWDKIQAFFAEWGPKIGAWVGEALGNLGAFVGYWAGYIGGYLGEALGQAGAFMGEGLARLGEFFAQLPARIGEFLSELPHQLGDWAGYNFQVAIILGGKIVEGILTGLSNLGQVAGEVFGNFRTLVAQKLGELWTWISAEVPQWPGRIWNFLARVWDDARAMWEEFKAIIRQKLVELWEWVSAEVPQWPGRIWDFLVSLWDHAQRLFEQFRVIVRQKLVDLWSWIAIEVPQWPGRIWDFLSSLPGRMGELWAQVHDAITTKLTELWTWISEEVPTWPGRIADFLSPLPGKVVEVLSNVLSEAVRKMTEIRDTLGNWAGQIRDAVLGPIRGIIDGIRGIWQDIIDGFREGQERAKQEWGISSPSRVAMEMAENIRRGFEIGLDPARMGRLFPESLTPTLALRGYAPMAIDYDRLAAAVASRPTYTINAQYRYQDERDLRDDLRLLQMLGAST